MPKPKMGRPTVASPRTRPVTVKFTAAEFASIEKAAKKAHRPIAIYIRLRTLHGNLRPARP